MIGNVVSIVVAPPAQIGDSLPKYLTNNGAPSKANISRIILAIQQLLNLFFGIFLCPRRRFFWLCYQDGG